MTTGPLRIVHVVTTDAFAGVERYVADVSRELAARGHAVTVVGGAAEPVRREAGPDVTHHRAASPLTAARVLRSLGRADIVHAHMTEAELAAVVSRGKHGGRIVATRHFAGPRGSSFAGHAFRIYLTAHIDTQIAISQFVADAIGEPATVLLNGVPASTLEERPRSLTVLMTQRLEREKDTATALRAWTAASLGADGWVLEICGDGAERPALEALARELDIVSSVRFLGFVTDTRARMRSAAIFLATAPAEPFGLAAVEAMAEGATVVAAASGAHLETVGEAAVLFPPGDVRRCSELLRGLAQSTETRAAVGQRLQERFAVRFTVDQHVNALERIYRETVSRTSR